MRSAPAHAASTARTSATSASKISSSRITLVLFQIAAPADNEIVEHANAATIGDQTIDKMTANEARSSCHQIKHKYPLTPVSL